MKSLLVIAIATLACTVSSLAQNVPSYIPTDGLVGWWPFNGNANDESGNGNDGTPMNGVSLATDRNGISSSAYNFDGVDDNIKVQNNITQFLSDFTITFWFKTFNNGNSSIKCLISKENWNNNDLAGEWWIYINHMSINKVNLYIIEQINQAGALWPNDIVDSQWHLVCATRNDSTGSINISIDGASPVTSSGPVGLLSDPSDIFIGGGIYPFNGVIDDIGIWNRALTQQEITSLYTATSTNNNGTSNTTANVPGAISYQAVARDAQGAPLADTNLQVRFTLLADSLSGSEEYVESHTLSTNSLGLFTTAFGAGTPVSNTFDNINWSAGHKFMNVQVDTGTGMVDMGTQQLLSTPYSLYSAKAGEIKNPGLPVFSDNAAALAGGLVAGDMYRTAAGVLMVVY
jgi:hypothetical protein